jgi:hypothetical protein
MGKMGKAENSESGNAESPCRTGQLFEDEEENEEDSRTLRFGGRGRRVVEAACAGGVAGANGGKHGDFGQGEFDHLFHNSQDQFGAAGDGEFPEKPVQVHVNGVRRNLEAFGNFCLVLVVEDALNNLHLPLRDAQGAGNLMPDVVGEQ